MIVPLNPDHIDEVAQLHCAALTGLLSQLGESAARAYYSACLETGAAAGFADLEQGRVRGFVLGSAHPDKLKPAVLRSKPWALAAGIAGGVLRRPSALTWLLSSFKGPEDGGYDASEAELTYLAVSPDFRKSGIGGGLVGAFARAMSAAGVPSYGLSVDDGNAGAIAFYERSGFKEIGRYREFGSLHRRYRFALI